MPRLSDISASPMLRTYAQGAAQSAVQPVADFIAPAVEVGTSVGRYKKYTQKNRFHVPDTRRAVGGRATEIGFTAEDETFNCEPHAIDAPVDVLEEQESEDLENILQENADMAAEVGGLAHEKSVIDTALAALGSGTDKTWDSSADPIDDLDGYILNVIKAARYGSLMGVGLLFGPTAFRIFKNHTKIRGRFVVGNKSRKNTDTVTVSDVSPLLMGQPEARISMMVYDTAKEGLTDSISFLLDSSIIVFARKANATRRDPSFMKTFRLRGQWMVPGTYQRDDGRVDVAKFDWSEDVVVTNSAAGVRLNISAS